LLGVPPSFVLNVASILSLLHAPNRAKQPSRSELKLSLKRRATDPGRLGKPSGALFI
jgi:hypothetical protein